MDDCSITPVVDAADLRTGVNGYRFIRLLGEGGMGRVWEAEKDGVRVALKVFMVEHGNRDFLLSRFRAEAPLVAHLNHAGIVRVRDWGVDEATQAPYFAMDLVLNARGEPETLETARRSGDISLARLERWYRELSAALAYLHAQGIVHRDVKLENVLLDAEDHAVLTDFGVARVFDAELRRELQIDTTFIEGETTGTRPVMGTYWYIPPEVRSGAPVSPASDRYALGVLFFRLLTGAWYEPPLKDRTNHSEVADLQAEPLELLAPFPSFWRKELAPLLGASVSEGKRSRGGKWLFLAIGIGLVSVLLGVGWWCFRHDAGAEMVGVVQDGCVVNRCMSVSRAAQVWGRIDCGAVTSLVIRASMQTVRPNLFKNWTNLVQVVFEEGVTTIGVAAFNGCCSLERVEFPSSLKRVNGHAFGLCSQLREVRFGANLEYIGRLAFYNCWSLKDVYVSGPPPDGDMLEELFRTTPSELTVHVPPDAAGWPACWPDGYFGRTVKRDWRLADVP